MTPIDFITDHLVNIDGLFDKHENGDEQKPHTPNQTQHHGPSQVSYITYYSLSLTQFNPIEVKPSIPSANFMPQGNIVKIFHPPIV